MKFIKSIFYFCSTFAGVAVLFEIILHVGGIMTPVLTIDAKDGERYLPNKMVCSLFNYEGFGLAETNSAGWFGNDPNAMTSDETSIAILGNSFMAARQVFYRHNFISLSEQKLQDENIHFYNFGKETMPLRESLYIKEELDATYHPDYFIVFINERSLGNEGRYIPYYELNHNSLVLNTDFKDFSFVKMYQKIKLINQSSLVFLLYRVKNRVNDFWSIVLDKFYTGTSKEENDDLSVFDRPVDEVDAAVIRKFDSDKRVIFLFDLDEAKTQIVKSYIKNSPIINIHPALMQLQKETGIDPYYWPITGQTGHWNYNAHRAIAKIFSAEIDSIILKK